VRRAKDGVKRPVLYKGAPVKIGGRILYHVQYSDQLLIVVLKRFRRQLYCEHFTTEHTAKVDIAERLLAARRRLIEMRGKMPSKSQRAEVAKRPLPRNYIRNR
jgi:hypothetical protein